MTDGTGQGRVNEPAAVNESALPIMNDSASPNMNEATPIVTIRFAKQAVY